MRRVTSEVDDPKKLEQKQMMIPSILHAPFMFFILIVPRACILSSLFYFYFFIYFYFYFIYLFTATIQTVSKALQFNFTNGTMGLCVLFIVPFLSSMGLM